MKLEKILKLIVSMFVLAALSSSLAFSKEFLKTDEFKALEEGAQKAIKRVIKDKEVKDFLGYYPNWSADAYADSETKWHVDFKDDYDWIGNAHIDFATDEIYEVYLIRDLTTEEFQVGRQQIEDVVFTDPEVLAILGNKEDWGYDVHYDKWSQEWHISFWKGIDDLSISFWEDDKGFHIEEVYDPEAFTEQEEREEYRNRAVDLAYTAEDLNEALEGVYDWTTYAEPQSGMVWGVEFTSTGKSFYAVVNIETREILETRAY